MDQTGGILGGLSSGFTTLTSAIGSSPLGPVLAEAGQKIGAVVSAMINGNGSSLLSGLFATGGAVPQASYPWQALFNNTSANLQAIGSNWLAHPFPLLQQLIANQNGYANEFGANLTVALQNWPTTLANVPANIQLGIHNLANFNYGEFINRQIAYNQASNAALQQAGADLQARLPIFGSELTAAYQAAGAGDYVGAVQRLPQAFVDLFLSGVNINNFSTVTVQGPAGDLMPISDISAQQQQDLINLLPAKSIAQRIAQNFFTGMGTATSSLGLTVIGPPIATLNGLALGATAVNTALQTGNGMAVIGVLADMPAYALNGFLNGDTIMDLTVPVTTTVNIPGFPTIGAGTPVVVHMPFQGILTQPQPITATIEASTGVTTVPIDLELGDIHVAGAIPTLLTYMPMQVAAAIAPK